MPAIEKPAHWTDIIPAGLPLARGVPYVATWAPFTSKKPYRGVGGDLGPDLMKLNSDPKVRIDLDDPQGWGYAWRLFVPFLRNKRTRAVAEFCQRIGTADGPGNWRKRWEAGETTDADRVDLAKALAEVMS